MSRFMNKAIALKGIELRHSFCLLALTFLPSFRFSWTLAHYRLRMWPRTLLLLGLAPFAIAVTSITQDQLTQLGFTGDGSGLAYKYAPIWFFGQAQNQPPCVPTWAFGGSPTSKDIYDDAHKTAGAPQCQYPNVGCNCRNPGVAIGNPAPAFPIYHSIKQCSDTQVRIAYNVFYQKDGAKVLFVDTGHA